MNKKSIIIILIIAFLALVGGGYYYWKIKTQKSATQQTADDIQKTVDNISNNVSPDVTTPAINLPNTDANPYNKTNPFTNLKTNPFQ
ncbi:MAG: hypothetical protein WC264_03405 [Candidatus Paceibacterota bacterium]|jgi:flagellar basal body-associated protein FliL